MFKMSPQQQPFIICVTFKWKIGQKIHAPKQQNISRINKILTKFVGIFCKLFIMALFYLIIGLNNEEKSVHQINLPLKLVI